MPVSNNLKLTMPEKKEFDALPANLYQVQIEDIRQVFKRPYKAPQDAEPTEEYLTFEFLILNEGEYRGRKLWKDVRPVPPTPSEGNGFKPSWMWRIVSAVFGKPFTFQEGAGFGPDDVNSLIGRQLRLMVNQNPKGDKVYNNITDVLAVEKEMEPVIADNIPSEEPPKGKEKARAVANSLPGAKRTVVTQADNATVTARPLSDKEWLDDPTDGEINPMVNDKEIGVEDILF